MTNCSTAYNNTAYLLSKSVSDCFHRLSLAEHIVECPVEWIVESGCQVILIRTDIRRVPIIYFSYLKYSCSVTKLLPEISLHLQFYQLCIDDSIILIKSWYKISHNLCNKNVIYQEKSLNPMSLVTMRWYKYMQHKQILHIHICTYMHWFAISSHFKSVHTFILNS